MRKVYFFASLFLFAFCLSCNSTTVPQSISYATMNYPGGAVGSSTYLTGIRGITNSSNVYISGIYAAPGDSVTEGEGLLYTGPITGGGTWQVLNYPSSAGVTVTSTALYGPNNGIVSGDVQIVGNYTTSENGAFDLGLLYQGPTDGSGSWTTLDPQILEPIRTVHNTIAHSTMGGLVVGNYDTDLLTGKAFLYNIAEGTYLEIVKSGAVSITAYGIWHNGGTSYTIAGGYSDVNDGGIDTAYLVDYDSSTDVFSNMTSFTYNNQAAVVTHFEGITTDTLGGYNLVADSLSGTDIIASFVNVPRSASGTFGTASWTPYDYPGSTLTSANTVYLNYALGIYEVDGSEAANGYVTTIPE